MVHNFTLVFLSQHYPYAHQPDSLNLNSIDDEEDIIVFLKDAEQPVNSDIVDRVLDYASVSLQRDRLK